ncbi:MAG TPA: hypothetical protein VJ385_14400 [Fibrobacteria bacterium]|nr:hypothetical protein [Fibrobacteria bacterium]
MAESSHPPATAPEGLPLHFLDEKGRDTREKPRQDSLARARALEKESERREYKKNFYRAIRLQEYEDDCVAHDPALPGCIITVEQFNQMAEGWSYPGPDSSMQELSTTAIGKARMRLLSDALAAAYVPLIMKSEPARDSLSRQARESLADEARERRREVGDSSLRALYRRFREPLFQPREELDVEILATSDSARARDWGKRISVRVPDSSVETPVWRRISPESLPGSVLKALRGAGTLGATGPMPQPYGYLLLRTAGIKRHPGLSFEEAMPTLLALAGLPPEREDAVNTAARAYYQDRRHLIVAPDTNTLRVWLVPDFKRAPNRPGSPRPRGRAAALREDTARFRSLIVNEFHLPPEIRHELDYHLPIRDKDVQGPLRTAFGKFYFQLVERKRGGRPLSFQEAFPAIRKSLFGSEKADSIGDAWYALADMAEAKEVELGRQYLLEKNRPVSQPDSMGTSPDGKPRTFDPDREAGRRLDRRIAEWMKSLTLRFMDGNTF